MLVGHKHGLVAVKDFILVGILESVVGYDEILLAPTLLCDGVAFGVLAELLEDIDGLHVVGIVFVQQCREPVCGCAFVLLFLVTGLGLLVVLAGLERDGLVKLRPSHLDYAGFCVCKLFGCHVFFPPRRSSRSRIGGRGCRLIFFLCGQFKYTQFSEYMLCSARCLILQYV